MTSKQLKMQQKISLTNLYYNRFLAIRYSTAFFLFLNLYWSVFLLGSFSIAGILPVALFLLGALTAFEQVKLYRNHDNRLPYANVFFSAVFIASVFLMIVVNTLLFHFFFPFFKNTQQVLNTIMLVLSACLLISFLIIRKIKKILRNEDRLYQKIQAYQQVIN